MINDSIVDGLGNEVAVPLTSPVTTGGPATWNWLVPCPFFLYPQAAPDETPFNCIGYGTLPGNATATMVFQAGPFPPETENCASLLDPPTAQADPDSPPIDQDCVDTPYFGPSCDPDAALTIEKESAQSTCDAGQPCPYKIKIHYPENACQPFTGPLVLKDEANWSDGAITSFESGQGWPWECDGQPAASIAPNTPVPLPAQCATNGPVTLQPGETEGLTVDILAPIDPASQPQPHQNCVKLADGAGTVFGEDCDNVEVIPPVGTPDLIIKKEADQTHCTPGEPCTFTVTITNIGAGAFTGHLFVDDTTTPGVLPLGGWGTPPWDCDDSFYPYRCKTTTPLTLAGGGNSVLTLSFDVPANFEDGAIKNCAELFDGNGNPIADDCAKVEVIPPVGPPELIIHKEPDQEQCTSGEPCTFTVTIENVGTGAFTGYLIVDDTTTPAGVPLGGWGSPPLWDCDTNSYPYNCKTLSLVILRGNGGTIVLKLSFEVPADFEDPDGVIQNCADLFDGNYDPIAGHCAKVEVIPGELRSGGPDIELTKSGGGPCKPGEVCAAEVTIANRGPGDFDGPIAFTHELGRGRLASFASVSRGWRCRSEKSVIRCERDRLFLREGLTEQVRLDLRLDRNTDAAVLEACAELDWGAAAGQLSVRDAQAALARRGYDPGPADGQMGPKTRSALMAFQRDAGLSVSGRLDGPTADRLLGAWAAGDPNPANDRDCGATSIEQVEAPPLGGPDVGLWAELPQACRAGEPCRIRVVFHNEGTADYGGPIQFDSELASLRGARLVEWSESQAVVCRTDPPFTCSSRQSVLLAAGERLGLDLVFSIPADARGPHSYCAYPSLPPVARACLEFELGAVSPPPPPSVVVGLTVKQAVLGEPWALGEQRGELVVNVRNTGTRLDPPAVVSMDQAFPPGLEPTKIFGEGWDCGFDRASRVSECRFTRAPVEPGMLPEVRYAVHALRDDRQPICATAVVRNAGTVSESRSAPACVTPAIGVSGGGMGGGGTGGGGKTPDLTVELRAGKTPWKVGSEQELTAVFRNLGGALPADANVMFRQDFPPGLELIDLKPAFPKYRRYSVRREGDSAIRIMKL